MGRPDDDALVDLVLLAYVDQDQVFLPFQLFLKCFHGHLFDFALDLGEEFLR